MVTVVKGAVWTLMEKLSAQVVGFDFGCARRSCRPQMKLLEFLEEFADRNAKGSIVENSVCSARTEKEEVVLAFADGSFVFHAQYDTILY